jgi:catechol-2,3-dioxygenase
MPINRLNHAVLYVRDIERSLAFYRDILGFTVINMLPAGFHGAAFLQAPASTNDHDLGLFAIGDAAAASGAGRTTVGLYHLAWEVDTLSDLTELAEKLTAAGALVGSSDHSTTKSLYAQDPDGIELEIAWIVPADRLDDSVLAGRSSIQRLDLPREIERYGADTRGGTGISHPAGV